MACHSTRHARCVLRPLPELRGAAALAAVLLVTACGGGGGGSASPNNPPPPPPGPTAAELAAASRFAASASFGVDYAGIEDLARTGTENWLDEQFGTPVTRHQPLVEELIRQRVDGRFAAYEQDIEYLLLFRRLAWWHATVTSDDVLRQRTAFALSEIFVVSDNVDALIIDPIALANYYDMLLDNAFGNFRDLLRDVTLHPAMGIYLSHVNNRRADPAQNIYPDENYAREVMQLFTIGLFELHIDGSLQSDNAGQPVATYTNTEIREFAKIFTGLSFGGSGAYFGRPYASFTEPMQMFEAYHEPGEKHLLGGTLVPAGQTGMQDVEGAIDNLFNHPNTGPFIGKQLIQRLVTSNPSPDYVERVARAFNGDTTGIRGDMRAVLRAVLLDPEARAAPSPATPFGKLREPVVRYAALLRQLGARSDDDFIANTGYFLQSVSGQHPLSSPSVFNFFSPAHMPQGEVGDAGLLAPEFQIATGNSIIGMSNLIDYAVIGGFVTDAPEPFLPVSFDLAPYVSVAGDVEALLDRLDLVLTAGTLDPATRSAVASALAGIDDPDTRARIALYLVLISPDYAVRY
jgi:uncharacterized protein (DUF1800 family)